jgi:hypothetical protein
MNMITVFFRPLRMAKVLCLAALLGWLPRPASAQDQAQPVKAELKNDRVLVWVNGQVFTEYLFTADSKYPYFYPVIGPRTGHTITTHKTEPYPHHSSLFFGCDRINGGNYWQEGLERGRIVSKGISLAVDSGRMVVIKQKCSWERPGAESPFSDSRTITIQAPGKDLRFVDFEITMEANIEVQIEKNNHSLFAARMIPALSTQGGGTLRNAHGDLAEKGTFGKSAPWADYRGQHHGEIEGLAIFCDPQDRWFPPPWFTRDYGFFSPTPMFWLENNKLILKKGEQLHLRYRTVVHAGNPAPGDLDALYKKWTAKQPD